MAIDIGMVSEVLLADGWHDVKFIDGESTFELDSYEFIQGRGVGRDPLVRLGGGQCEGVPSIGAKWFDVTHNAQIYCPVTRFWRSW